MYKESLNVYLNDLENKEKHVAGGGVVGMLGASACSLMIYVCNKSMSKRFEESLSEIEKLKEYLMEKKEEFLSYILIDEKNLSNLLLTWKNSESIEDKNNLKQAIEDLEKIKNVVKEVINNINDIKLKLNQNLVSDIKESFAILNTILTIIDYNIEANM